MTSRLDRLFVLLENCPNASLRAAAAEQLGEVAKNAPSNIDYVFTRLVPLLRHKNWVSRVAASDAIRAIVHHLPEWDPILARSNDKDDQAISTDGFLSLNELRLDRVLAQGARLYSMDARELDKTNKRSYIERCKKNDENTVECDSWEHQTETYSPQTLPSVQRQEINSRLGLESDSLLTQVLETHADVSINKWITPDDLADEAQPGFVQLDVETCVRSTYVSAATASDPQRKRSSPCQSPPHCDAKRTKLESQTEIPSEVSQIDIQSTASGGCSGYFAHWPLDKLCTTLLGDLWALRWETRHGAAAGLRELLSEPRHTRQAGKYIGQTQRQMQSSHRQYLEDIVVRVLCTLALDQLSDFISDEVVAPVRETAAQLLGVLSLHLTAEQVLLVTKHLIYLVSLNDDTVAQLCNNIPCQKENTNTSKNSWMIAHGGLLGIKYLLASRKDLKDVLLPHVAPCLISRLFGIPISTDHETSSQHNLSSSASVVVDDEDIRAAAGSALLPIIDTVWIESLSQYEYNLFVNHVWSLIRKTPSDLSPSTGPVLSLICALTKAECEGKHLMRRYDSTFKSNEDVSIYQIDTSTKIVIIAKLLHHVSSSIRQSALNTLQCVIESCEHQAASLSVDTLYIILDNLFQRILLEPCATIRALVTNLIIEIINSAQMDCLVQASIRRLDVWLCQVMQPTGIPYPNKFLVPCLQQFDSSVQVSSELNTSNNGLNNQEVLSSANTNGNSNEQRNVFISNQTYCIGGFQCLTASRSEMEAYVLETRISAVRVLANLCGRVCQYNQLIPVHLLPCISEITESSSTQPFSSVNNDSSSISVMNYILGQLLCQLHLKDRLAMQRFISGLLLSAWALLSPFSSSPSDTTYSVDSSMTVANDHISLVDRCEQLPNFHMLTYTWANLLNESSKLPSSSTSSSVFLPSYLDALKTSLSGHLFTNIQTDLQDITKRLRGRLESCLTEVIYYEEILAPFKLMQEDCRELIRSMKTCGLTVDSQIPVNGVLTIAHCKALLQTVASTIQKQKHQFQTIANCGHDLDIDSFKLDRLCCQFERTRTTVDHCLTLQLYLGNRVELGIACAFANLNWILPGRLSLLIRPLMDTIRCMKPCVNLSFSTVQSSNSSSSYACSNSSVPTSASVTAGSPNTMLSSITNSGGGSNSGNASVDILPIGTCIYLQRLAACCLARLLWLEWKMLLDAKLTSPSSLSTASKDLHVNTSKAAAKVIKNLTAYLIDSDPDLLLSSTQTSDSSTSEINRYLHEDQLLDDAKMSCGDQTISVRLDTESTSSSPSSYESQCQSSQYRGAYNTLSCICHAFITFYHCEEVSKACQFSSSLSSQTEISKSDSFANYPLTHASLNSVRFGLPSLWSVFWVNPVEIIISAYRQLDSFIENGKSNRNDQTELDENNYSLLKKLSHETKLNNSSLNAINVPKSKQDELVTGLTLLSVCLNVILPCLDPDRRVEKKDDVHVFYEISFEQIIWLGSLVVRLPYPACRRIGARLLAELTLLQPVHTLNILLPLLLLSNDSSFLISDSSAICIGALETFLTIVDKFTNTNNKSTYMLRNIPPAILNDPLVEPNSKSSCLLSVYKKSIGASRCSDEQLMMKNNTEVKLSENLSDITVASSTIDNNHSAVATELSLSSNLKLFLPYLVLLLTPTLRLISSANEETRSVAGKLFTALLNLLPLETSLPNPEKMKEEFKQIRVEHREFIDSLLHPDRIQLYNLPIKIKATLRSYQQDGVNWLCFLNRYGLNGILCDDLGLGKTLQTICILAGSHHELKQSLLLDTRHKTDNELTTGKSSKSMPKKLKKMKTTEEDVKSNESMRRTAMSHKQLPLSLVVCPSTLCGHWFHEIQQYAQIEDLNPLIYAGSPTVRQSLQSKFYQHDIIITSYDSVRSDVEFFKSIDWNYIILDEGHIIKSSKSKITRAVKQLVGQHRLILTGTPIQNRVSELWSLFDFLMPEFLGSEQYFLSKFARPVAASRDVKASKADQRAGQLALEKLHRLVLPFMLRRLKEDVMQDLPPKIIQDFACKMTSVQRKLYETFQKTDEGRQLMNIVCTSGTNSQDISSNTGIKQQSTYISSVVSHGFQAVRYFQAVCNHPCLVLKSNHPLLDEIKGELGIQSIEQLRSVHLSGKLLALCRLLTDCGFGSPNSVTGGDGNGCLHSSSVTSSSSTSFHDLHSSRSLLNQHRALIFFQTREMLQLTGDMLRELFPWITATRLDGTVPVSERHSRVVRFNQDPSIDVMLLTTAVGGLGLNLTGADTVIFVEHDWNPSKDLQAMDRAHRIGQLRTVNVYRLITEDSIEEQIMNLQAFKLHLANTILTTDNKALSGMDTEHLFDRLTNSSNEEQSREGRIDDSGQSGFALLDEIETCYETEYNLDTFISRLKMN